jgi:hypothetical protein
VLVVLPAAVLGAGLGPIGVLLPFVAVAVCTAAAVPGLPRVDRWVERLTRRRAGTPYAVLAEAAARIRSGTPDSALPGLAQVLAEGTRAREARVWLAVSDRLVPAAHFPPGAAVVEPVANLAVLLDRADTDHVVPIVEGTALRAALAIRKDGAITPADQQLMRDVAGGAGLLLRGVAMNTELADRVRRADELAAELDRSRERLSTARDVERRRLVGELGQATADRIGALRLVLDRARQDLTDAAHTTDTTDAPADPPDPDDEAAPARAAALLVRARIQLDALLDRFRVVARGVYPAVLKDQGPVAALEEVAADLDRTVRVHGEPDARLPWEVESGVYYVAASALQWLAAEPGPDLAVELVHAGGRLSVRVVDPAPPVDAAELRRLLVGDLERLAALGGELLLEQQGARLVLAASLPERLEPAVEVTRGMGA